MKLKTDSGNALELIILRYEFSDVQEDRWDSNWLVVSGTVATNGQSWHFSDPAVTTFELAELAGWLRAVALGENTFDEFEFTEPNLAFFLSAQPVPTLRVRFAHESAPPWITDQAERIAGVFVDFPLAHVDVAAAADELRDALNDFPIRGGAA
jgi:hypothetical protein